jgi:hypothetical protein
VVTLVATVVARKGLEMVWVASTGRRTPNSVRDTHEIGMGEALAFAGATGATLAIARTFATRKVVERRERTQAAVAARDLP